MLTRRKPEGEQRNFFEKSTKKKGSMFQEFRKFPYSDQCKKKKLRYLVLGDNKALNKDGEIIDPDN